MPLRRAETPPNKNLATAGARRGHGRKACRQLPEQIAFGLIWRASRGPELRAEPLLALAATVSGQHHTDEVLVSIVRGLAEQPDVALARVWLRKPGGICPGCAVR